jgi:hypothetical protein
MVIPAQRLTDYSPEIAVKLLDSPPDPFPDKVFIGAIEPAPPKIDNPTPIKGFELFGDRLRGWLLFASEAAAGSAAPFDSGLWPPLPAGALPLGASFVFAPPHVLSQALLGILQKLPEDETALVVSHLDFALESLASSFPGALALMELPDGFEALKKASLPAFIETEKAKALEMAKGARALLDTHKEAEAAAAFQIDQLSKLSSLERSQALLRDEARQRRPNWEAAEEALARAREAWNQAGRPPKGLGGLIGKKARLEKMDAAKALLDKAETLMRDTRVEMESLLGEVRTVEAQLDDARALIASYPPKEELMSRLSALQAEGAKLLAEAAGLEAAAADKPLANKILSQAKVVLARPWWPEEGLLEPGALFDNVIIAASPVHDHKARQSLVKDLPRAKKRFIAAGDLSPICWTKPPPEEDGGPAWRSYLAGGPASLGAQTGPAGQLGQGHAPKGTLTLIRPLSSSLSQGSLAFPGAGAFREDPAASFLKILGPLPESNEAFSSYFTPNLSRHSWLSSLSLGAALSRLDLSIIPAVGPGLRAAGESGPASPGSALAAMRLALEALKAAAEAGDAEAKVYILTATPTQTALNLALAHDLGAPKGLYVGRPSDLATFPKAALVIMDAGLAPPQTDLGWSAPEFGRPAFLKALGLASGALVVAASKEAVSQMPKSSLFSRLWRALEGSAWPSLNPPQKGRFSDCLDKAKDSAFLILPPFDSGWWPQLAPSVAQAARRRLKLTILASIPEDNDLKYSDLAIRDLRLYGANVILSQGFDGFLAIIDDRFLSLGRLETRAGKAQTPNLSTMELPKTALLASNLIQRQTIAAKLGPGSLRACPACGWPYVLLNDGKPRDLGDKQPLKLGCLNPACQRHKRPRRLDERWPFQSPPLCPEDGVTRYELQKRGKRSSWVCPKHPDQCPVYKLLPGDCPDSSTSFLGAAVGASDEGEA